MRSTRRVGAFLVAASAAIPFGLASSSNPKSVGSDLAAFSDGLIVRNDHPGVGILATTSLEGFVVLSYLPSADSVEGREALTRVGAHYERIQATGSSFSAESAEEAVESESYFQDKPYVGVALAEVRESSRQYRLIQVSYLGGLTALPESVRSAPVPLARGSSRLLDAWYSRLESQLGLWFRQEEFHSWESEARHYQLVSADARVAELIERGRELMRTMVTNPEIDFELCPKTHGPGSENPNKPKCDECCEAAGGACDLECGKDAAVVAIAGCAFGAAACAPGLVAAAGCCAATGGILAKGYDYLCHLSCAKHVKKCIYAC